MPRPVGTEKLLGDLRIDDNPASKWLFTGHRGSGKSTELIRLAGALADQHFTVYSTVDDVLDMADVDYKDVLLSLDHALYVEAKAKKVRLPKSLLEDLVGWYSTTLREVEGAISAEAEVEEKADFWFLKLLARQRSEVATREVIRRQLESRLSDLIARIDEIVRAVEKRSGKPVLVIVDGLDKVMDLDKAQRMYYKGGAISGSGTLTATVVLSGQVNPGGVESSGVLTIVGNYTQAASGVLNIELGGPTAATEFDQLKVTDSATLNGTLGVSTINGFVPGSGDSFQVLTYGSHTGEFTTINGNYIPSYNPTNLTIIAQ